LFSDLNTALANGSGVRGDPGYYDVNWRKLTDQGLSAADARKKARYRLRYAVIVEELDSHVPCNATGRDTPLGREVRETDPDVVVASKPFDPKDPGTLLRRVVRYSPQIFNLSFCSEPFDMSGSGRMPLYFGSMIEHIFQGRGLAANVDQTTDGNSYPLTWPLMYRRNIMDSQDINTDYDPRANPSRYNVYGQGNTNRWDILTSYLYVDGAQSDQPYKYGGKLAKQFGTHTWNDNTMDGSKSIYAHTLWHGLMGRFISFTHIYAGLG